MGNDGGAARILQIISPSARTGLARVGAYVWRRVVAVFNRISAAEEGVHKFIE